MNEPVSVRDIVNALPEERREKVIEEASRITQESLLQSAQELLEDYYEERDRLVGEITTFQEALDNAKEALKNLNKKNKSLLKQVGSYKSQDQRVFDLIAQNPGLLGNDLKNLAKANTELCHFDSSYAIHSLISNLLDEGLLRKEDGRYYTVGEFKTPSTYGVTDFVRAFLKIKPATKGDIVNSAKSQNKHLNRVAINNALNGFIAKGKVTSSQTYRGQRNVVYTWIGERE